MRNVAILIPASPTTAFFSQIAALNLALERIQWKNWKPSLLVCFGGDADSALLTRWRPFLQDVTFVFAPPSQSTAIPCFYAQIDGLLRWAPGDADLFVRMDADTLPVGSFEDVLDYVYRHALIAGVIAHFKFPTAPGRTAAETWLDVAANLITAPLDFSYAYSLTNCDVVENDRICPFYVNDGAVFISSQIFKNFARLFLDLRPRLMHRLADPYYAGQIAVSLAVTELRARALALPMRYNFPNDDIAVKRFPEELEEVKIFHYLRTHAFNRGNIFASAADYAEFTSQPLEGVQEIFRRHVVRVFGESYPFAPASPHKSLEEDSPAGLALGRVQSV